MMTTLFLTGAATVYIILLICIYKGFKVVFTKEKFLRIR